MLPTLCRHLKCKNTQSGVPYSCCSALVSYHLHILEMEVQYMIKKIDHNSMGRSRLSWLDSWFHFSFAEYYNPDNMHFGTLRVVNDDTIQPHTGFDLHPHRDMEIITYVIEGELTHGDSMQNVSTLNRGDIQYMSAGTGVFHSEKNNGNDILRLLQIWILPDRSAHTPQYGEVRIPWKKRENRLLHIVSGQPNTGCIQIHQDMDIYVSALTSGNELDIPVEPSRQVYAIVIEGEAVCDGISLQQRDAAEIDESFCIKTSQGAHIMLFDMPKDASYFI